MPDLRSIKALKRILLGSYSRIERHHLTEAVPRILKLLRMSSELLLWVVSEHPLHVFVCSVWPGVNLLYLTGYQKSCLVLLLLFLKIILNQTLSSSLGVRNPVSVIIRGLISLLHSRVS